MGQRFQIIVKTPKEYWNEDNPNNKEGAMYVYHCQWLWGYFSVWRMGQFMKAIKKLTSKTYRKGFYGDTITYEREVLEPALKWICYKDLFRQNNIYSLYEDFKFKKSETWFNLLESLDNNNGIFFLEITQENKLRYFFFNPQRGINEGTNQNKLLNWKTYLKDYENESKEIWLKDKEFLESVNIFKKTPLLKDLPDLEEWMYIKENAN